MDHNDFFERYNDYVVTLKFYESQENVTVERLYQMFLERMKSETEIFCGRITDKD